MSAVNNYNHQGGYMALTAAILLSVTLLLLVIAVSSEGYYSRYSILESDQKEQSIHLAEACANIALLEIAQDSAYSGNETRTYGTASCTIGTISVIGFAGFPGTYTMQTSASVGSAVTNLEVRAQFPNPPTSYTILAWEEVP